MKLTKGDIKKYGTPEERKILEGRFVDRLAQSGAGYELNDEQKQQIRDMIDYKLERLPVHTFKEAFRVLDNLDWEEYAYELAGEELENKFGFGGAYTSVKVENACRTIADIIRDYAIKYLKKMFK